MDEWFEIEVEGDATGDLREDDINKLRASLGGVKSNEMILMRKSMDPEMAKVAMGAWRIASEHADVLIPSLGAYLIGRMGRKVTVTVDGNTITAGSKEEIEALIPTMEKIAKAAKAKKKG